MNIDEKFEQVATVSDTLADALRSKPEHNYEALVLALVLAVTGTDAEKVSDVVTIAEGIAARLSKDDVERAQRESLKICDEIDDLNPILVIASFENRLNAIYSAYFPWHRARAKDE
jgi:hypothetical protein